jgi:hypothetical protein
MQHALMLTPIGHGTDVSLVRERAEQIVNSILRKPAAVRKAKSEENSKNFHSAAARRGATKNRAAHAILHFILPFLLTYFLFNMWLHSPFPRVVENTL